MTTPEQVRALLADVSFPGYTFLCNEQAERMYIQAAFVETCAITGSAETQFTCKWYVSRESTKSEIVQTALKCVLTSVEHEARERFQYGGRAIFAPHYDVDALWEVCGRKDTR